jgi:hypothetical protein
VTAPVLVGIDATGTREAWGEAGFTVDADGGVRIGHVRMQTGVEGRGISAWTFAAAGNVDDIDGLTTRVEPDAAVEPADHRNGSTLIDHIVVFSPDGARTTRALGALGLEPKRQRETNQYGGAPFRQTFFRAGEVIIELVGPAEPPDEDGPARFFGIACTVRDLDACAALLGDALGNIKDAVQPGRRIATLRHKDLGLRVPVAFMSDEPA